mmetsp:Transcript_57387/g.135056  ORF Transcript_57387/g.135056 Transcript_57387/m.135056 type:complete len:344 (+) Transcript_57387:211-1242(+)
MSRQGSQEGSESVSIATVCSPRCKSEGQLTLQTSELVIGSWKLTGIRSICTTFRHCSKEMPGSLWTWASTKATAVSSALLSSDYQSPTSLLLTTAAHEHGFCMKINTFDSAIKCISDGAASMCFLLDAGESSQLLFRVCSSVLKRLSGAHALVGRLEFRCEFVHALVFSRGLVRQSCRPSLVDSSCALGAEGEGDVALRRLDVRLDLGRVLEHLRLHPRGQRTVLVQLDLSLLEQLGLGLEPLLRKVNLGADLGQLGLIVVVTPHQGLLLLQNIPRLLSCRGGGTLEVVPEKLEPLGLLLQSRCGQVESGRFLICSPNLLLFENELALVLESVRIILFDPLEC